MYGIKRIQWNVSYQKTNKQTNNWSNMTALFWAWNKQQMFDSGYYIVL